MTPPALADPVLEALLSGWEPEPDLTVSAWADDHRVLSPKASAEPGRWRTARTPYLREIMDSLSASADVEKVVFMKAAQLGATECGNNWLGYIIHHAPGPALMVQPTVEVAKRVSKQRLAPMIAATPALSERVSEARSRDSGNTVLVKEFPGGLLIITGANSGAGLRSMPIRYLFGDEIDEYPGDVDDQGDPLSLAEKRTTTFARRKIFYVSTPTLAGLSRVEREFKTTDQRRFFLPCPACGAMDWLRWENMRWENDDPATAHISCVSCSAQIDERHKTSMLERGEWRPTAVGAARVRGYHLSGLYSPLGWKSWPECVAEFLKSKNDPFLLKTWVNTVLGETWEERGTSIDADSLLSRAERYPAIAGLDATCEVPAGVGILIASVDVQDDRLEVLVTGYGAGEESWVVAHTQFYGDPGHESLWFEMDAWLREPLLHQSGQRVSIEAAVVDSGGHHTDTVYRFCKARERRRAPSGPGVFAIRGGQQRGTEIAGRPSRNNRYRVKLFTLGVDTAKDVIYSRLRIARPGPGHVHLPHWIDQEFVEQLTAEKAIRKYERGRGAVRHWVKVRERNEVLDLSVYCLAGLYILGPAVIRNLPQRAARLAAPPGAPAARLADAPELAAALDAGGAPDPAGPPKKPRSPRRPGGWVGGWRK